MSDDTIDFWFGFFGALFLIAFVKLVVRVYDLEDKVQELEKHAIEKGKQPEGHLREHTDGEGSR